MLQPKKTKHRKLHKGRRRFAGKASRGTEVSFGSFGLRALEARWITDRQIEATRRVLSRFTQKGGKVWIRIFPDKPVTSKGQEVPMGGGKGSVDHFAVPVKPGRILFEIDGVSASAAAEAIRQAGNKLPIKTKLVKR
ncbi:MAG: 50S ribosomal protein L16 [Candidatus Portnoybacteria bacterium CG_4_8_14_3_um_filter_44_10]|uniref:Large ribosomal subunit protein uL16 n=5 Tax=Candidatus Portnoyibacteriota TaxID=1817913 RepID=A0A2H0KTM8_9BACT|nr:MAG: 50S ribosomal protein L16 [Parcubacteria group bacterium CG2_30_44_18]PIQ74645.1 MAG: 50S ribosomal protein L16 [Candidatus Portnoybacteria bacterium CG11_big_fil_rev_8_21_14_0_20_44_10]PIS16520.1 MAG: 50S ribosomal protein L16 [Candidatus Portnoybacteria bacterium CG09_land_8_20_14_0_10_44_13]PIW75142.1 MAG: 50S ribosomal protein L16 [Candidatus Portnoybacteria bacterium CG_4_8_14_3_um_filter_44_10]PIZ69807.1 MAG: 50S ribosomal protein L16 [Candidatus Portnoybacteria bacterium CG_4_10_